MFAKSSFDSANDNYRDDNPSTKNKSSMTARLCGLVVLMLILPSTAMGAAVVLQYHHVSDSTPPVTSISVANFAAHMAHLKQADYQVLPLPRIIKAIQGNLPLPEKAIAITFDDAYLNAYKHAYPILKRYGYPATIFVATDLVGSNADLFLDWAQLREMESNGFHIGNHTRSHPHLLRVREDESPNSWAQRIRDEITSAQAALDREIVAPVKYFAYPYGEYNKEIVDIVSTLGYVGFGQQSGAIGENSNFSALPRFPFGGIYTELEPFQTKAATLPMPIVPAFIDPLGTDLNPAFAFSLQPGKWRSDELACFGPGGVLEVKKVGDHRFTVTPVGPLPSGRSRYNCTMPSSQADRYYWHSQLWIRKLKDGSWYPEP